MPREELYLQDIVKSIDDVARFLDGIEDGFVYSFFYFTAFCDNENLSKQKKQT